MRLFKTVLAVFVFPLGLAGCNEGEYLQLDTEFISEISSEDIPTSIEQGVQVLNEVLPEDVIRKLVLCDSPPREVSCREFNIIVRLRLQRRISNEWIRPVDSLFRQQIDQDGLSDPEEIVSKFMRLYIRSIDETLNYSGANFPSLNDQ